MEQQLNKTITIIYDMGHGGIDPVTNQYTTAPAKMYKHEDESLVYHNGSTFYEGVKNRVYGNEIVKRLRELGFNCHVVNHDYIDTPLKERVNIANDIYKQCNYKNCIFVSEHSNATSSHSSNAKGISLWTSVGKTKSDILAQIFFEQNKDKFIFITDDKTDKDADYEQDFYVLKNTKMPAILFENQFFDNKRGADLLMSHEYFDKYCSAIVEWIIEIDKKVRV